MPANPFIVPFEQLPKTLPIFPLPGAVLMPGNELPLNIFEPRYLNMISDALSSHRMIGMIQPDPDTDDSGLCRTGCAGRISQYRETNDGRLEIQLSGVCRYDVDEELPTTRGYRLIIPDWSRFPDDYIDHEAVLKSGHSLLLHTLKRYFDAKQLEIDWTMLERLPTDRLMNSLSMALPVSEQDKQVLLETVAPLERFNTFIALLDSELEPPESITRH
jgi:hypothetical protein